MKMHYLLSYLPSITLFVFCIVTTHALDCQLNESDPHKVFYTITVDKSGHGNFTTVQSAIDSVPAHNARWIRVQINPGVYTEKVVIPIEKPCIFLEGAGMKSTRIEFDDHQTTSDSPIFISHPDNIVAKGITFKNTFNYPNDIVFKQAPAIRVDGDKSAFFQCSFIGIQDTLLDRTGRHYFRDCYIEGGVDFIYGTGQSIYEKCIISINMGKFKPGLTGFITAQKKASPEETSGFVFKYCVINGVGKAKLGRAWGPYSTVVFFQTHMEDVIDPVGWDAWNFVGQEGNFTYVEAGNKGRGADTSKRVRWAKQLSRADLDKYVDMSYIDREGWLAKLPKFS